MDWKCETCIHFVPCGYRKKISLMACGGDQNMFNPYDIMDEQKVKEFINNLYLLLKDCDLYMSKENINV
jgi:hypothetical protein